MAEYNRQHFVPRCHLREFGSNQDHKQINIYNLRSERIILKASLRDQCQKNNFYGEDNQLEKAFHGFESRYTEALRDIVENNITWKTGVYLEGFCLLQHYRTEAASARTVAGLNCLLKLIDPEQRGYNQREVWDQQTAMREIIGIIANAHTMIEDLKWVIVKNESRAKFVTSDDPSIFCNRYEFQKHGSQKSGLIKSGHTIMMPLTPRHLIIFYDGQFYKIADRAGHVVTLTMDRDVRDLNLFQYIKAKNNIYFSDDLQRAEIIAGVSEAEPFRRSVWYETRVYRQSRSPTDGERYELVDSAVTYDGTKYIASHGPICPVPPRWPKVLQLRHKPKFFTSGSMVGHVRKPEWLTQAGQKAQRAGGQSS